MIAFPVAIGFRLLSLFGVKDVLAKKLAPLAAIMLGLLLIALAVLAFNWWLDNQRQSAVEADRAQSNATALTKARQADDAAQQAAQGTTAGIEASNSAAAEAASQSDDPLKAGLDTLRGR